jgi:hypothetical protein
LNVPSNAVFGFGTGDFTIETWANFTSLPATAKGMVDGQAAGAFNFYYDGGSFLSKFIVFSNRSANQLTYSFTPIINAWYHFAVARQGTDLRLFINGVLVTTASGISTNYSTTNVTVGGDAAAGGWYFPGYLSDVRIIKGTALYTANFTPPTAPLTAVTNTSLLLNATNAGVYDATAKTVEVTVGTAQASTAQFKFGTSSIALLNTANNNYLTIPASVNRLLTGDFTVEMWSFLPSGSTQSLYANILKGAATPNNSICASFAGSLKYMVFCGTPAVNIASTITSNDGVWHHLAFVRSGTTCKFYVDGTAAATTVTTSAAFDFGSAGALTIGSGLASDNWTNCYIDELRITKGVARYTANFTPPTAAFPTS